MRIDTLVKKTVLLLTLGKEGGVFVKDDSFLILL
jgi:hypothetical protein